MSVENVEQANEMATAVSEQRREAAEQRRESMTTADKILKAREQKTVMLDLDGFDTEFRVMLGDVRDEVSDIQTEVEQLAAKADQADEDDDPEDVIGMTEDEALDKVEEIRGRFVDILVEHATDESLTRQFWLDAYGRDGAGRLAMRLKEKSEKADMTEDELKQFRRNRD